MEKNEKNKKVLKQIKLLETGNPPEKPQHRFFRNIDILQSMIRGWFELEHKKMIKKNSLY